MLKKLLLGVVVGAALLASPISAGATTIVAYYSLNGGSLTLIGGGASDVFATVFDAGNFAGSIASGKSAPASSPFVLTSNVQTSHTGDSLDDLKVYVLAFGNNPGGNTTFTSTFTQNGSGKSGSLSSYLATPTSPFPALPTLADLGLSTLLSSATYPPNLSAVSGVASASAPSDYTLAAVFDIQASADGSGGNATINIAAVPGPIVGAGLPGLIAACGGLLVLARRRRKAAA